MIQYGVLGVDEFARQYVRGFATGGFDYFAIPLERAAFECQRRFEASSDAVFSVLEEVRGRLAVDGAPTC